MSMQPDFVTFDGMGWRPKPLPSGGWRIDIGGHKTANRSADKLAERLGLRLHLERSSIGWSRSLDTAPDADVAETLGLIALEAWIIGSETNLAEESRAWREFDAAERADIVERARVRMTPIIKNRMGMVGDGNPFNCKPVPDPWWRAVPREDL